MADMSNPDGIRNSGKKFHQFAEQSLSIANTIGSLKMHHSMGPEYIEEAEAIARGTKKLHASFTHHATYNSAFGTALHESADSYENTDSTSHESISATNIP